MLDRCEAFSAGVRAERTMAPIDVQIRWLVRPDMAEVLELANESFQCSWSEEKFLCHLRHCNRVGMVAEHHHRVVGYMIYEFHKSKLWILNFAVAVSYRRRTVGTQMINNLIGKISADGRSRILIKVRESNLAAQLFFKANGFQAVSVLREFYHHTTEDAYLMRYRYGDGEPQLQSRNCRAASRRSRENESDLSQL